MNKKMKKQFTMIIASTILLIIAFLIKSKLSIIFFLLSYIIVGYKIIYKAFRNIIRGKVFDENFLMTIATLGAFFINEIPEAVSVMLFYQIGEFFQDYAVDKSRKSISSLICSLNKIKPFILFCAVKGSSSCNIIFEFSLKYNLSSTTA